MDYSDKTRRAMSEVIRLGQLSGQAAAFLRGAATGTEAPQPVAPTQESFSVALPTTAPAMNPPPPLPHQKTMAVEPPPSLSVVVPAIVSVTFRLPARLSVRLASVSAGRKLQRERPFSQQDIVATALDEWLKRHAGST